MFKLDNDFLQSLGLGGLPVDEKNKLLQMIYERLEMNVGMRLAEKMTDQQLDEFESFIDQNDEAGALKWLETNFPNYKDVVAEELEKLKVEVTQVAPQILAAQGGAAPEPAIMSDPLMPGVPQPAQMPMNSPVQQQPTFAPQQPAFAQQPMQAPVQQPFYDQPTQHMQPAQQQAYPQPAFAPQQPTPFTSAQPPAQPMQPAFAPQQSFQAPAQPPLQPYVADQPTQLQPMSQPQPMQPQPGIMPPQPLPQGQPQPAPGFAPQSVSPTQPQQFTPPPNFNPGA